MVARAAFKKARWILVAVVAMSPATVFAQQDNASQNQKQQEQHQAETAAATPVQSDKTQSPAQPGSTEKQTEEQPLKTEEDAKLKSVPGGKALGMSILGNQEAPKALVIVPWKGSELGNALDISTMLDDSRLPIDKEVFMRMLSYYEIRSGSALPGAALTERNASPDTTANGRKK